MFCWREYVTIYISEKNHYRLNYYAFTFLILRISEGVLDILNHVEWNVNQILNNYINCFTISFIPMMWHTIWDCKNCAALNASDEHVLSFPTNWECEHMRSCVYIYIHAMVRFFRNYNISSTFENVILYREC